MAKDHEWITFRFSSQLHYVDISQEVVQRTLEEYRVIDDEVFWISLAVREALINAMKHGNKFDEAKDVELHIELDGNRFRAEIRDQGEGFDLEGIPDPLDEENLLKPSGRGIFYIRSFMDNVSFTKLDTSGMRVIMEKSVSFQSS